MNKLKKITVETKIPEKIGKLHDISKNLWWCWNKEATEMFRMIDRQKFSEFSNNPVKLLKKISQKRAEELAEDKDFIKLYNRVCTEFESYMNQTDTWFNKNHSDKKENKIAYFCAEFGVHESVPIYSGGLGVLAGDHAKSASDLGLPFLGVGLLYRQGYFEQEIDNEGNQKNEFFSHKFSEMPISLVKDEKGQEVIIDVDIQDRKLYARAWKMQVGRIPLYLLDADIDRNTEKDREITFKLYGGDQEMRISQEILLGIGGVRLLEKLDIKPSVWHMNEGHSVFLGLERIKKIIEEKKLSFYEALELVRADTIFTTHTPVPAGNDAFPLSLKDKYFKKYWESVGLSRQQFMELGLQVMPEGFELFSLTILAFRIAGRANGVSKLHGDVSSNLWKEVWKDIPEKENPVDFVTNGVHTLSWMAPEFQDMMDKYLGEDWKYFISKEKTWEGIDKIPAAELWETHKKLKIKLIDFMRNWIKNQKSRNLVSMNDINQVDTFFDPDALIIGFARRFATYKRATLIFRDLERLRKILSKDGKKIHLVFSGKAHPADKGGQALVKSIHEIAKMEGFQGKIFFLENYSLRVSRYLVAGVDVWLNNPRRPLEASGTSGQKVPVNGGLNFSILDGWWDEGFNGKNGWAINPEVKTFEDEETQAIVDCNSLYDILENDILEMYYQRDKDGLPQEWIQFMKESMKTVCPVFSTDNMVMNYCKKLYIPAINTGQLYNENNNAAAKTAATKKYDIMSYWNSITVEKTEGLDTINDKILPGQNIKLSVVVNPGKISSENIKVQFCIYDNSENPVEIIDFNSKSEKDGNMIYSLDYKWKNSGTFYAGVRIIPCFDNIIHPYEFGLAYWIS